MSYGRGYKRARPSRYGAFSSRRSAVNPRKGRPRIRRGDESYGGSVYRYNPQVGPGTADMKWMLFDNEHRATLPVTSANVTLYRWGNHDNSYVGGGPFVAREYLMPALQNKYVYLDDPWYCPMINTSGAVWTKRTSSMIMLRKMMCCFNIRPFQWQVPGFSSAVSGDPTFSEAAGVNKNEVVVNGVFRWWLILDTQCNGTRLSQYDLGPVLGTSSSGTNYIFDSSNGYVSTLNDLNRGRFKIVAVKDFEVCGKVETCPVMNQATGAVSQLYYTFVPSCKQYDFSIDLNIPIEWSGFSSTPDDSDQTYTTNRLFMVGAYLVSQGFQDEFSVGSVATSEDLFLPAVDVAMWIKTYFTDY